MHPEAKQNTMDNRKKEKQGGKTMDIFQNTPAAKKRWSLLALYVGIVGSIFVSATQSTMLPVAAQEIGGADIYPLVSTLTGVIGVVLMPLYGYFAAKNPAIKTPLFSISMILGAVSILSRCFVNNMWLIIIPGLLYSFASSAIYILGYSTIRDIFDAKKAGVYLGLVATFQSIGMLVGPMICGIIIDTVGWRGVNHLIWPFMLLSAILAFCGVRVKKEDVRGNESASFDFSGAVCLVLFLGGLILALSLGYSFAPFGGIFSNLLFSMAVIGFVGLTFVVWKKGDRCIVPVGVLQDKTTICLSGATLFLNWSTMAAYFFIPSFCIRVLEVPATQAGLTTTMISVAGLFMGPIYGKAIGKSGNAKGVLTATTILRIIITGCFIFLLNKNTPIILIYVLMLISGFYTSAVGVSFAVAPQLQIVQERRMQSNSVIQVCQNFGSSVGTAVYTLVISMLGVTQGMTVAFIIALICAVLGLLFVLPLKPLVKEISV